MCIHFVVTQHQHVVFVPCNTRRTTVSAKPKLWGGPVDKLKRAKKTAKPKNIRWTDTSYKH